MHKQAKYFGYRIPPNGRYPFLIIWDAIAKDFIIPCWVAPLAAAIGGVTLNGVNSAIFHLFHDTHLVGLSIWSIFIVPVEEDNHTRAGFKTVADPLSTIFEPLHTVDTAGEFGDNAGTKIPTFIGTPAYEAGTPFHPFRESVPAPIRLAAYISDL